MKPSALTPAELAQIADDVHTRYGDCASGAAGLADWLEVAYRRGAGSQDAVTSPELDQPSRTPHTTLVLAATYRSGSTLLADALIDAGGVGWPAEYFQRGAAERRFARFDGEDYLSTVLRHRTAPTGVFGVKLFPADLRDRPEVWPALPHPVVVRVRRRDRVGQAVSAWRALNGGPWRAAAGEPPPPPTPYDYESLRRLVGLFEWEDRWWGRLLSSSVTTVWFEDLAADYHGTLRTLLDHLTEQGLSPGAAHRAPRLQRQADAASEQMRLRFLEDHRLRAGG